MSVVEPSSVNLRNLLGVRDDDVGLAAAAAAGRQNYSGLTLEDILMREKLHAPPSVAGPAPATSRTLLDIIRNEERNPGSCGDLMAGQNRDRKSWKSLKDKIWLRLGGGGAGAGWASGKSTPATEFPFNYCRPPVSGGNSVSARFDRVTVESNEPAPGITNSEDTVAGRNNNDRDEITRERTSVSFGMLVPISIDSTQPENTLVEIPPLENSRNSFVRLESRPAELYGSPTGSDNSWNSVGSDLSERNTTMQSDNTAREATHSETEQAHEPTRRLSVVLALERELSERESEAARGAAEATSTTPMPTSASVQELEGTDTGARMSLMDLLEEAEGQQMGLKDGQWCVLEDADAEEENENDNGGDNSCCVCMVRHKGAAFIPCGHTFCRLCSRELWVGRGACPLCNASIQEVLDIF